MGFLTLEQVNLQDVVLEGVSFLAYIFFFVMILYARRKNKIFASKSFSIMILALILGICSAFMDFFTELYWFENYNNYLLFKSLISGLQIASLLIFAISLLLVFRFTKFMLGEDGE